MYLNGTWVKQFKGCYIKKVKKYEFHAYMYEKKTNIYKHVSISLIINKKWFCS